MNQNLKHLSKALSWFLRHGAVKQGFILDDGGYINVEDILKHITFKKYTVVDIEEVVRENDKQRFHMRKNEQSGKLQIRANQGHTIQVSNLELMPIKSVNDVPVVIHGTYLKYLSSIKNEGLSRMKRTHIHFSCGEKQDKEIVSGLRNNAEVLIYIDLEKALKDGLEFYLSTNRVVLSPGNKNGFIPPQYFKDIKIL